MRVLIVSGIFHPDVGGPATYLRHLADDLVAHGHTVSVLTYGDSHADSSTAYQVQRIARVGSRVGRLLRFTVALLRIGRSYSLWFVNDYGIPALVAGAVLRRPIVMKIVGDFAWEYARRRGLTRDSIDRFQQRRYGLRIESLKWIQRHYVRMACQVIVPSQYLAGIVRGWGIPVDRIAVIPNAVKRRGGLGRAAHERPETSLVFTAARLAPWKGIDHLLQALSLLLKKRRCVSLVIAGDGPERHRLERLASELGIENAVVWLGEVPHEEVLRWMARASVFVLLSEYEGLSHVLLEARAAALPVVASRVGGNPEVVLENETGLLVDPPAHESVASALDQVLFDARIRSHLLEGARRHSDDGSWPELVSRTLAVLELASAQ